MKLYFFYYNLSISDDISNFGQPIDKKDTRPPPKKTKRERKVFAFDIEFKLD